jgi:hypothetical protein
MQEESSSHPHSSMYDPGGQPDGPARLIEGIAFAEIARRSRRQTNGKCSRLLSAVWPRGIPDTRRVYNCSFSDWEETAATVKLGAITVLINFKIDVCNKNVTYSVDHWT